MKNLIFILLFVPIVAFGQKWESVPVIDKFGDDTGELREQLILKGKFSNSATTNSEATVIFSNLGERRIETRIIEYKDSKAIFLDDWIDIYIKKASTGKQLGRKFLTKSNYGVPPSFIFGGSSFYTQRIKDKHWAKYVKRGKELNYSFGGAILEISSGDKINILTSSGSNYNFEVK